MGCGQPSAFVVLSSAGICSYSLRCSNSLKVSATIQPQVTKHLRGINKRPNLNDQNHFLITKYHKGPFELPKHSSQIFGVAPVSRKAGIQSFRLVGMFHLAGHHRSPMANMPWLGGIPATSGAPVAKTSKRRRMQERNIVNPCKSKQSCKITQICKSFAFWKSGCSWQIRRYWHCVTERPSSITFIDICKVIAAMATSGI